MAVWIKFLIKQNVDLSRKWYVSSNQQALLVPRPNLCLKLLVDASQSARDFVKREVQYVEKHLEISLFEENLVQKLIAIRKCSMN